MTEPAGELQADVRVFADGAGCLLITGRNESGPGIRSRPHVRAADQGRSRTGSQSRERTISRSRCEHATLLVGGAPAS